ncbi:MAG: AI-2E family transporter [Myxococcota bacterium]
MSEPSAPDRPYEASSQAIRTAVEIAIRLGVILLIVGWCLQIIAPFVGIVIWAGIIAIATDAPFDRLATLCGGRRGLAAGIAVSVVVVAIAVPIVLLSETLVSGASNFAAQISGGTLEIPPPPDGIADWPVVGKRIHDFWQLSSENLEEAVSRLGPQLEAVSRWLLGAAGSAGAGILQLLASLVIAGVMLARSEGRRNAIERVATRLAGGTRGPEFAQLANATVQSVVQGILGVALIQSLLAGVGFMVAGIPAAGLWALLVLIAAVVQLPVALVMLPPIFLAFSSLGAAAAVAFTVWCLAISLLDNVLKPILFGRGVKVPTLVIFLGAIGGMLTMGIVGLFLGSVVLCLGYELFVAWLEAAVEDGEVAEPEAG